MLIIFIMEVIGRNFNHPLERLVGYTSDGVSVMQSDKQVKENYQFKFIFNRLVLVSMAGQKDFRTS